MPTKPKIPAKGSKWSSTESVAPFRSELSSLFPDEASLNAFLQNPNAGTQPWGVNKFLDWRQGEYKKLGDAYDVARQAFNAYKEKYDLGIVKDGKEYERLRDAALSAYNTWQSEPGKKSGWTTSDLGLYDPQGTKINQGTMEPLPQTLPYEPTKGPSNQTEPGPNISAPYRGVLVPTAGGGWAIYEGDGKANTPWTKGLDAWSQYLKTDEYKNLYKTPTQPSTTPTVPVIGQTTPTTTTPQINPAVGGVGGVSGLLNTGPLNNYTQPFTMPKMGGGGGNQAMQNLAGASMDLWDYKKPNYNGVSATGAANWSDLLNFGG